MEEQLLTAWLKLSSCIWNRRLVNGMSYNEALVFNLLNKQEEKDKHYTATELCSLTNLLKSQMNRILCQMEDKGLIQRIRSNEDKRNIYIMPTDKGREAYLKEHQEILGIVRQVIDKLGYKKAEQTIEVLNEVADAFKDAAVERK
jgi:DNA-binding MarR family transcriptional regulator